jgi:UDP-N-acetyl-2-amino-2-deoxyglucuronate dehydrogenase
MSSLKKKKFVILGFGHIGKRHAEEVNAHPLAEIVAIIDTLEEELTKAATLYKVPVFNNLEVFLASGIEADIINICTPNGLHTQHSTQAIRNGFHILIEKPAGLKKADCSELLLLAEKHHKHTFCVLQNRYSPPAALLKKLVTDKSLGKILWVEVSCYWNRDERYYKKGNWRGTLELDGGTLFTQFSHFIDLLYWIFGGIKNPAGFFANCNHKNLIEFEDTGTFHFEFNKEGAGVFNYSTSVHGKNMESSFIVLGEKGSLKIGGQYMDKLDFFDVEGMSSPQIPQSGTPNQYGSYQGSANNHALVIENIIKALNNEPYEIAMLSEAMESVGIIEEIYKIRDNR